MCGVVVQREALQKAPHDVIVAAASDGLGDSGLPKVFVR